VVRGAFPASVKAVAIAALAAASCMCVVVRAQQPELSGMAAVADAVLWGRVLPPPARTGELPPDTTRLVSEYRQRQQAFHSALTAPRGATAAERQGFEKRVGVERSIFCLFPRRESARVAAQYALDADIEPDWEDSPDAPRLEARFIDGLLVNLSQPWLAPYLNLSAGHRKLCAGDVDDGRRQIARARDAGHALIRAVAEYLLQTNRCVGESRRGEDAARLKPSRYKEALG
jgi:hypothetical protein